MTCNVSLDLEDITVSSTDFALLVVYLTVLAWLKKGSTVPATR
jgi:hypothetical protein